jgi:hypothetical protein
MAALPASCTFYGAVARIGVSQERFVKSSFRRHIPSKNDLPARDGADLVVADTHPHRSSAAGVRRLAPRRTASRRGEIGRVSGWVASIEKESGA